MGEIGRPDLRTGAIPRAEARRRRKRHRVNDVDTVGFPFRTPYAFDFSAGSLRKASETANGKRSRSEPRVISCHCER